MPYTQTALLSNQYQLNVKLLLCNLIRCLLSNQGNIHNVLSNMYTREEQQVNVVRVYSDVRYGVKEMGAL